MTDKTKKIIAREGLFLLGYIVLSAAIFCICKCIPTDIPAPPEGYFYEDFLLCYQNLFYSLFIIIIGSYPIYFIVRLIIWLVKASKEKKINKNILKRIIEITFDKDTLIRVILILGILYLSISLLKSCGFIKKKDVASREYLRLLR